MAMTLENAVPLPDNIKPYISTSLAFDNIDRLEETLNGGGTSHRIKGIAIRAQHFGPDLPPVQVTPVITKSKQRSLEVVSNAIFPSRMQLKYSQQRYKGMLGRRRIFCGFLFGSTLLKSRTFVGGQGLIS